MFVVGTHCRNRLVGLTLGSIGHRLAAHAGLPVVIVPPTRKDKRPELEELWAYRKVIVWNAGQRRINAVFGWLIGCERGISLPPDRAGGE